MGRRTRRKFVRLFMGSASWRRIIPVSSRSLASRMASRASSRLVGLRVLLLFEGSLEDMKHRNVLRAIRIPLTSNNISEGGNENRAATDLDSGCPAAETVERSDPVYLAGEIHLELRVRAEDAVHGGDVWIGLGKLPAQESGGLVEFSFVGGGSPIKEVEIERGDRGTMERGAGVADQNGFQLRGGEGVGNFS